MPDRTVQRTLSQLDFERRKLSAKLSRGNQDLLEHQKQEILRQIDALDFEIAASPANTVEELLIKLEHLSEILFPEKDAPSQDTFEGILFCSVLKDVRTLSGPSRRSSGCLHSTSPGKIRKCSWNFEVDCSGELAGAKQTSIGPGL
jgi:hypothetical protein